jgi:alkylation response protein AidB-like acyl-CoA dehydrogenase
MEFRFTDEQQMIRETAEAFLREQSDAAAVRRAMATEQGFEDALWEELAGGMGWSAMHIPEAFGGLGLGAVELVALMEEMGKRLLCAPFFSSVCMAATAILCAGSEAQKAALLPDIASGAVRATLGWMGVGRDWSPAGVSLACARHGDSWRLQGESHYVVDGHTAGLLVLAARLPGEGLRLFAVPAESAGLSREWLPTMDQTRKLATLRLDSVQLGNDALLGPDEDAGEALQKTLDIATIALAAEQSGVAQQVLEMAVAYTKERHQFGRAIASFQSIKHKAADMMLKAEASRSAAYYAACVADEALRGAANAAELAQAASLAKAHCSETAFFNAGSAIQMYGGVGFTWEYDVHLYFKRARASEEFLGAPAWHRERIAQELGL